MEENRYYLTEDVEYIDLGITVLLIFWTTRSTKMVTKDDWLRIKQEAIDESTDNP